MRSAYAQCGLAGLIPSALCSPSPLWRCAVLNVPCAARACLELLDRYGLSVRSRHVVVLGRSAIVGLPLSLLLLHRHAALSNCDSHTPLAITRALCQQADVVISGAGRPELITKDWVRPGCVLLDVGINYIDAEDHATEPEEGHHEERSESSEEADGGKAEDEEDGVRLVGDVDLQSVWGHAGAVSPVPGGIGPVTIACLLDNTLRHWLRDSVGERSSRRR